MTERDLQAKIIRAIRDRPGWWVVKYHQDGRYAMAGVPDVLACYAGRLVALEVKMPGKKSSLLQQVQQRRIASSGGVVAVVDSLDKALDLVYKIEGGRVQNG